MADPQYDDLKVVGLHEPDFSMEPDADGNKKRVPLPGLYTVGVMIGDKFMPVHSWKAGSLVDDENVVQAGNGSGSRRSRSSASSDDK